MTLMEGKKVAESIYAKILLEASLLPTIPKIVFILVGEDPASQTYVRSKGKKSRDLGFLSETMPLPASITEEELIGKIRSLNKDKEVHGILLQLPLPKGLNKDRILSEIDPLKDVDGLHPENAGRLMQGNPRLVPCTPLGIIEMLKFYNIPMEGRRAVVIGRSEIVGKPMAQLLLMQNATVTICHSKTPNLEEETKRADIVVAALGKARAIGPSHVKEGAVVVDVGIHRIDDKLCGDVDFEKVADKCAAISPVPGGVGPLTIAMLMKNLVLATTFQTKRS
jgi:methylenetetrahydrofolate dehydrogenase (NADP+)/methenyltetrahydrofolate cyclohydrolase